MMTNIYKEKISQLLAPLIPVEPADIAKTISVPPSGIEGDFSVPCFTFARILKKSPKIIAEDLIKAITLPDEFSNITAAGGYVNFLIDPARFARQTLNEIQSQGIHYGEMKLGQEQTVTIDFSSPNMGKELAFHHLRGTMLGNSLSRIYKHCGYNVIRINHLGDWGTSYGKLITMYLQQEVKSRNGGQPTIEDLNTLYKSFSEAVQTQPELEDKARQIFKELESGNKEYHELWDLFRTTTLDELKRLYSKLDVEFDQYLGEAFFTTHTSDIIAQLEEKGLLADSQGTRIVDLSEHNLPPLMMVKTDGSTLYQTRDICAAIYRYNTYKFARNLYVVDNGQSLHFQQIFKVLELMGYDWHKECLHIPFGLVLTKNPQGKWERGKSRAGQSSLLKDVIQKASEKILNIINQKNPTLKDKDIVSEKIAIGALVFNDIKNKRIHDIKFDWDCVLSFDGDTGPYVLNAYVRLCSILRKHGVDNSIDTVKMLDNVQNLQYSRYLDDASHQLLISISRFGERLKQVIEHNEPYILAQYALELAESSHSFIHANRVLGSSEETERLLLINCTRIVMRNTLYLLGIPLVEEM
jgi:arginyl-tRNA synthetase